MRIDKVYILALNVDQQKIDEIQSKLDACGFEDRVECEILVGHDGWNEPLPEGVTVYEGFGLGEATDNPHWKLPVQPGEIGCTLSHINAWKRIAEGGEERCLILEEDFVPLKPMSELPEPNPNWPFVWDFLNLGRWVLDYTKDIRIDSVYSFTSRHYNMQSYILTKAGAQKLVDYKLEERLFINDEFINATFMKHPRPDIEAMFPVKTITALGTHVDWFNQDHSPSLVSTHSPQGAPDSRHAT